VGPGLDFVLGVDSLGSIRRQAFIIWFARFRDGWVVVYGKYTDQGRQSLPATLLLTVLHFKVDVVEIADAVLISLLLFAQFGHFMDFRIVHNFQHILSRVGTQVLDLDLIGFETLWWHARRFFDFLQND
jgi:hypothetical protein